MKPGYPKPLKIVVPKGMKKPHYQSPGQKGQITVVACGNAAGNVLPPLIIFDAKNMQHALAQGEVPGSRYGTSDKGWITTGQFESWFYELFLPNAVSAHPLLLLLDGLPKCNQLGLKEQCPDPLFATSHYPCHPIFRLWCILSTQRATGHQFAMISFRRVLDEPLQSSTLIVCFHRHG